MAAGDVCMVILPAVGLLGTGLPVGGIGHGTKRGLFFLCLLGFAIGGAFGRHDIPGTCGDCQYSSELVLGFAGSGWFGNRSGSDGGL